MLSPPQTCPQIMADHSSIHPSESLAFPATYRFQAQGHRSSHSLFQNSSMGRLSQYGDSSNLLCEPVNSCATAGTSMNGVDEQINSGYWDMESSVSSHSLALNRTKAHTGAYEEEWNSNSQQQDAMEDYGATVGNHQKLDSFSEAFYSRSVCRITNSSGEQGGYSIAPNNSSTPPLPSLSFPLVLSPPPTPLPPPSLSTFSPAHWLPLSTDAGASGDITQHLAQDPSPSSIYPEGVGLHLRQLSTTHRDTDGSLETSPCSPLGQHPQPQSVPKLVEHDPITSEDHMTWSQTVQSSQPFCPPLHQTHTQAEGPRVDEDTKPNSVLQRKHFFCLSSSQNTPSVIYTGVPFHSVLQSGVLGDEYWHANPRYTPPPMLNPNRNGTGLFCNLLPLLDSRGLWSEETRHNGQQRYVNIGPEFQANLPDLLEREELEEWPEEPLREELLWKPWAELEESDVIQEHVENLLDLSTSTALPGGGANLEFALHSLSLCQGNIMGALEMMFFSNSTPSRDYHYAGSDVWRLSEQKLFHKAFAMYGKDFSFIHKMVKTKQISQCVEFYYHSKRLQEKQRKQKEREKEQQQQMDAETTFTSTSQVVMPTKIMMNPINMERLIHTPSLATSFPCKQCGKMFYKIKSRNAHMKIHRQQQEDWRERIHPNNHHNLTQALQNQNRTLTHANQLVTQNHQTQLLTQSLIQNLVQSQAQLAFLQNSKTQSACFTTAISSMGPTQSPQTAPKAPTLPLYTGHQQAWGALHGNLEQSLYYN
ncbi:transcriptional-regulating factor 1 [Colossoma macropomum]|uniref:transcriptional-regulating factor 1 n=1 Tax=Colossoma macropomum TaxID=42526 RepID=UPI00186472AC|nr:transcriptional-regulating factor 1 [Colossoma macropomum]XP_036451951.1 transcriptional-regulating factor 1 [Colossoma macropomum]XP_036451952.1 transcriptional-regulating factor 1 [Colossoma macropomum]XP_036451953.1 transcriptional-regulating factor 1 [Colossoma macropomum]